MAKTPDGIWRYSLAVLAIHAAGGFLLLSSLAAYPRVLALGFLAYTLGLRHAFDADHIAAIDSTVRKLARTGHKSQGVGFYFSLGHSTVVFLLALALAFSAGFVSRNLPGWRDWGAAAGTLVSGVFLVLIGVLNLFLWFDVLKIFFQTRQGGAGTQGVSEAGPKGFLTRLLSPLFRIVTRSGQMYFVGFLFGLGFDTASEVTLLALSAQEAAQALPWSAVLCLPVLFAAGMSLLDSADGFLMARAYGWSFSAPLKKLYYNLSVTGLSVLAALLIGGIELLQVLTPELGWNDGIW